MMKIESVEYETVKQLIDSCVWELNQEITRTQSHISKQILAYQSLIISYPDIMLIHRPIFDVLPNFVHVKLSYHARIGLAMGIAVALQDLHHKNICLRNLQPAQIVILSINQNKYEISFSNIKNSIVIVDKKVQNIVKRNYQEINQYTAPEIVQKKPYSLSCDIWSLGAILYEIFFTTEFTKQKWSEIGYPANFPSWIVKFLEKMLSIKQQGRQRIEDVIKVLEKAQFCAPEAAKYFKI